MNWRRPARCFRDGWGPGSRESRWSVCFALLLLLHAYYLLLVEVASSKFQKRNGWMGAEKFSKLSAIPAESQPPSLAKTASL